MWVSPLDYYRSKLFSISVECTFRGHYNRWSTSDILLQQWLSPLQQQISLCCQVATKIPISIPLVFCSLNRNIIHSNWDLFALTLSLSLFLSFFPSLGVDKAWKCLLSIVSCLCVSANHLPPDKQTPSAHWYYYGHYATCTQYHIVHQNFDKQNFSNFLLERLYFHTRFYYVHNHSVDSFSAIFIPLNGPWRSISNWLCE